MLSRQPLPPSRGVAVLAVTTGPGLLAADACEAAGLEVVELSEATREALVTSLPEGTSAVNPVIMVAEAAVEDYLEALRLLLADDAVGAVLVIVPPPVDRWTPEVTKAVAAAGHRSAKPVVANVLSFAGGPAPAYGLPTFRSPEGAALALAHTADYADWRRRPPGVVAELADVDTAAARLLVDAVLADVPEGLELHGDDAAQLLGYFGIRRGLDIADVETVVGVVQDPSFGPLVMLDASGPLSGVLQDRSYRVTPITDADARELVQGLRSSALLGAQDRSALEDLVQRVGRLVDDVPEVAEMILEVTSSVVGAEPQRSTVRLVPETAHPDLALRRLR